MGTMTEWQDVGMNGDEKAQLQAIYDEIVVNSMEKYEYFYNVLYTETGTSMYVTKSMVNGGFVNEKTGNYTDEHLIIKNNIGNSKSFVKANTKIKASYYIYSNKHDPYIGEGVYEMGDILFEGTETYDQLNGYIMLKPIQ